MRTTAIDDAVLAVARRQHGVFSRAQAFTAGASGRFVGRRLAAADWLRLDTSVYALPSFPGTWERQLWVALCGSVDASVAGRSAAVLHELADFRRGRPEVLVGPTTSVRSKVAVVHRFAGARLTRVAGFPVTDLPQTIVDLALLGEIWRLERAVDDSVLRRRLSIDQLDERIDFYGGAHRHGMTFLRAVTAERRAEGWQPPESELEALAISLLAAVPGLDLRRQVRLPWRTSGRLRVDLADERARLIVELDGRRWHARLADFDRDRWRDNEAVAHGWRVLRFTWVHLTTAPDAVVGLVRRTIAGEPLASSGVRQEDASVLSVHTRRGKVGGGRRQLRATR